MFEGLQGVPFSEAKRILDNLSVSPLVIQRPPENKVLVEASGSYSHVYLPIGVEQAVLLRGGAFTDFLSFTLEHNFIPNHGENLDEFKLLPNGFNVQLLYDEQKQNIHVHLKHKEISVKMDMGSGPKGALSQDVRTAIGALAVMPDELWNNARKQGLIVGVLDGDFYDKKWKVKSYSLMIDDYNGILSHPHDTPDLLLSFDPENLRLRAEEKDGEKVGAFMTTRQMIGIFADVRTAHFDEPPRNPMFG